MTTCYGKTKKDERCKNNATYGNSCHLHKNQINNKSKEEKSQTPVSVLNHKLPTEIGSEKEMPIPNTNTLIQCEKDDHSVRRKDLNPDIELGDLLITKGWIGPPYLTYQHSGMIVDIHGIGKLGPRPANLFDVVDCLMDGCGISRLAYTGTDTKEVRIVRLKKDFPRRKLIIYHAIWISYKIMKLPNVTYANVPFQFGRLLLKKCFRPVSTFEEAKKYYEILKDYLNGGPPVTKKLAFFCSRFSLLVYQLAVLLIENGNVDKLHPFFSYEPKYCRPGHVASLADESITSPYWEKHDIVGFAQVWHRV
jgi:hypothetical protein